MNLNGAINNCPEFSGDFPPSPDHIESWTIHALKTGISIDVNEMEAVRVDLTKENPDCQWTDKKINKVLVRNYVMMISERTFQWRAADNGELGELACCCPSTPLHL